MTTKPRNPKALDASTSSHKAKPNQFANLTPSERPAFGPLLMPPRVRTPRPRQTPDYMRQTALAVAKSVRSWAAQNKVGTVAATFPEPSQPGPSRKRSCRVKRADKVLPGALRLMDQADASLKSAVSYRDRLAPIFTDDPALRATLVTHLGVKALPPDEHPAVKVAASMLDRIAHNAAMHNVSIQASRQYAQRFRDDGEPESLRSALPLLSREARDAETFSNDATSAWDTLRETLMAEEAAKQAPAA